MAGFAFAGLIGAFRAWHNSGVDEWKYQNGVIYGPLNTSDDSVPCPIAHVVTIQGKGPAITQCSMLLECKDKAHNPECSSVLAFRARVEALEVWRELKAKETPK